MTLGETSDLTVTMLITDSTLYSHNIDVSTLDDLPSGGEPERACIAVLSCTQTMDKSRICHCLLFREHGKQKLYAAISLVNEATTVYTHTHLD